MTRKNRARRRVDLRAGDQSDPTNEMEKLVKNIIASLPEDCAAAVWYQGDCPSCGGDGDITHLGLWIPEGEYKQLICERCADHLRDKNKTSIAFIYYVCDRCSVDMQRAAQNAETRIIDWYKEGTRADQ